MCGINDLFSKHSYNISMFHFILLCNAMHTRFLTLYILERALEIFNKIFIMCNSKIYFLMYTYACAPIHTINFVKPCVYSARNCSGISDGERIDQSHWSIGRIV